MIFILDSNSHQSFPQTRSQVQMLQLFLIFFLTYLTSCGVITHRFFLKISWIKSSFLNSYIVFEDQLFIKVFNIVFSYFSNFSYYFYINKIMIDDTIFNFLLLIFNIMFIYSILSYFHLFLKCGDIQLFIFFLLFIPIIFIICVCFLISFRIVVSIIFQNFNIHDTLFQKTVCLIILFNDYHKNIMCGFLVVVS